jgi:hypothetical protein
MSGPPGILIGIISSHPHSACTSIGNATSPITASRFKRIREFL